MASPRNIGLVGATPGAADSGHTAYGTVPGPIATPPSVFDQLGNISGFKPLLTGTENTISGEQSGTVSANTLNALKNAAATFGVTSGMPGSGLETNSLFGNIAGFSENQQNRGIKDFMSLLTGLGPTMTNPNLAASIADRNAMMASAPDPEKAAMAQLDQWMQKFKLANANPAGGTGTWKNSGPSYAGVRSGPNLSAPGSASGFDPATDFGGASGPFAARPSSTFGESIDFGFGSPLANTPWGVAGRDPYQVQPWQPSGAPSGSGQPFSLFAGDDPSMDPYSSFYFGDAAGG